MQEERLMKWVQRSVGKNKIIEAVDELLSNDSNSNVGGIDREEKLFRMIAALDVQGPVRVNGFASTIFSFPQVLVYGMLRQKKGLAENVLKIIVKRLWTCVDQYTHILEQNSEYTELLDASSASYHSQMLGFGMERVMYTLNPMMPCLSSIVMDEYVTNIQDLLKILDRLALQHPEKVIFDRHIISFIINKIDIKRDMYASGIRDIPKLRESATLYGLFALVAAHQKFPSISVSNLSKLIGKRIVESIESSLHNVKLKKSIIERVVEASDQGHLAEMLSLVSNSRMYHNDTVGYNNACNEINMTNKQIAILAHNNKVSKFGTLFGQRITVLMSYMLFVIITLTVIV
jgi:hypothetical protein